MRECGEHFEKQQPRLASVTSDGIPSGTRTDHGSMPLALRLACNNSSLRHTDIRTTMNVYGTAVTADMREAHVKIVRLALARA